MKDPRYTDFGAIQNLDISFLPIEKDIDTLVLKNNNQFDSIETISVQKDSIIFFFGGEGQVKLSTNLSDDLINLGSDHYYMMAYPFSDWKLTLRCTPKSSMRCIVISLVKLHNILDSDIMRDPSKLNEAIRNFRVRSHYTAKDYNARLRLTIEQLFINSSDDISNRIFKKGKIMEFLSLFMSSSEGKTTEDCPYIRDNLDLKKIHHAEKILIDSMQTPPTIKELAHMVGTNELKLKEGFKHHYGNTIFGYLMDYKMNKAKMHLERHSVQIKEVSSMVGYSNPSHFIAAFRKKFGVTPKKFVMSL